MKKLKTKKSGTIALLLGSGVSYPSGLPTVGEITDALFNEERHQQTDQNFYPGEQPQDYLRKDDITPHLQRLLYVVSNMIGPYLQSRVVRREPTYEDIYEVLEQVKNYKDQEINNPAVQPFAEKISQIVAEVCPVRNITGRFYRVEEVLGKALRFIECVVCNKLFHDANPVGIDLLPEIIHSNVASRVVIGSLNHDLLIEKLFEQEKIPYADGFGQPDGDIRQFDPSTFDKEPVKLFKLHGSINWFRYRGDDGMDFYAIPLENANHPRNAAGNPFIRLEGRPSFLTGVYNKLYEYNFGIYADIRPRFREEIKSANCLIVSGYGWNDRGINGMLFEWLLSSKTNRLVLLHQHPDSIREDSKSAMWHRYDGLVNTGKIIPIKKWFSEVKYAELEPILNQVLTGDNVKQQAFVCKICRKTKDASQWSSYRFKFGDYLTDRIERRPPVCITCLADCQNDKTGRFRILDKEKIVEIPSPVAYINNAQSKETKEKAREKEAKQV